MRFASLAALMVAGLLAGCSQAGPEVVVTLPPVPDERFTQVPAEPAPIEVSKAAAKTRDALIHEATRGSLRGLGEIAARNPGFKSNLGGQ